LPQKAAKTAAVASKWRRFCGRSPFLRPQKYEKRERELKEIARFSDHKKNNGCLP
jgi:hypothetical protein